MKKRIGSVLLALALCLSLLPATALAEGENGTTPPSTSTKMPTYSGGSGTAEDPWLISTVGDLKTLADTINTGANVGNYHGYYFKQTANLDLSIIANWEPIGYSLVEGF